MEVDPQDPPISNAIEKEDFEDLFEQHNHYPDDRGFESDDSYHPSEFSLNSNSDSDIDRILPQFEEPEFSDSDDEQETEEQEGHGAEVDLLEDMLFRDRGSIFGDGNSEDEEDFDEFDDEFLPPAFQEHPAIRNAYIRAFLLAALKGSTHEAVQMHLEGVALALRSAEAQSPDIHFEGLSTMARTLTTTERRLGICTDRFITYFFLCDVCWKLHHPSDLSKLHSPTCDQDGCAGTLYTSKRLSSGSDKRTPTKIMPYVRLKKAVQHLLLRPGKYEQLQHWRCPELDEPGPAKPFVTQGYDAFIDLSISMTDVYDGWGWRAIQAGLERRRGGKWTIEDIDVHELHQRFVSLPLGLVFQMNIDWYVVYLMICVIVNHCVLGSRQLTDHHIQAALYTSHCATTLVISATFEKRLSSSQLFPAQSSPHSMR
jgi:hypothetical protein